MPMLSITELEQAINILRNRQPAGDDAALSAPVRALADIYGEMIYRHTETISFDRLNEQQIEAMKAARNF